MTKLCLTLSALSFATLSTLPANAQQSAVAAPAPALAESPAPIEPPVQDAPALPPTTALPAPMTPIPPVPANGDVVAVPAPAEQTLGTDTELGARTLNEFQGDDVSQVLRLLARQAKLNLVISDRIDQAQPPLKVTMRLENKSAIDAIRIIATSKGLILDNVDDVYYVKTKEEKESEPTESANYTFSYASAEKTLPLLAAQLQSKVPPQFDPRTNTVFYREVGSNLKNVDLFLETIDKPTQQVMIEARLVEVTANPRQSYGVNWAGVVGGSTNPQTIRYGGSTPGTQTVVGAQTVTTNPTTGAVTTTPRLNANGVPIQSAQVATLPSLVTDTAGRLSGQDFLFGGGGGNNPLGLFGAAGGQFAILSAPSLSVTLRMLNEDSDAEFLAHPRIVTANNQKATIKITRNQPVPQLNFNEQTATAVFGGFQDKEFGNTLNVTPGINKDDYVTLLVQPEISNKVGDSVFTFAGATVASPIIDKRNLESNVLIKSGDTLAIGGLLQDETLKQRTKVPILGDIPIIGYAFQEKVNARTKRNLLVFVTPTIIKEGYGTGLESQVNGLTHSGEEFADPNGWRNNAKGAVRLTPTSNRPNAADYPKPGVAKAPVRYKTTAITR